MDTWIEGLNEYRVIDDIDNSYFLDVEYHVLRYNKIPDLLPIQVRDQDGTCRLLYDISGMKSMKDNAENHVCSLPEYRTFLSDCSSLLKTLDDYMLDISQIVFDPDGIYWKQDGHVRWMYVPSVQENIAGKIVRLFEWLLSIIDYEDFAAVQFAYHAFRSVRNHTFSGKMIEDCLNYEGKEIDQYTKTSYREFFQGTEEEGQSAHAPENHQLTREPADLKSSISSAAGDCRYKEADYYPGSRPAAEAEKDLKESKRKLLSGAQIACGLLSLLSAAGLAALLIYGIRMGISRQMVYIYVLTGVGLLILLDCTWQLGKHRKLLKENVIREPEIKKTVPSPSYNYSWEEPGGTQVLGIRKDKLQPALRDKKSGRIYTIEEFPYYIGSESGSNQLVVAEPGVSRRHAAIVRGKQTGYYDLQDLCSTNGTWINQTSITYEKPVKLESGDEIRFAGESFEFLIRDYPLMD